MSPGRGHADFEFKAIAEAGTEANPLREILFPRQGRGLTFIPAATTIPGGLAWHPETGDLYASEHGPSGEFGLGGNDEINRIKKGQNYGWPLAVGSRG